MITGAMRITIEITPSKQESSSLLPLLGPLLPLLVPMVVKLFRDPEPTRDHVDKLASDILVRAQAAKAQAHPPRCCLMCTKPTAGRERLFCDTCLPGLPDDSPTAPTPA